jgi:hypothetical protein
MLGLNHILRRFLTTALHSAALTQQRSALAAIAASESFIFESKMSILVAVGVTGDCPPQSLAPGPACLPPKRF